MAEQLFIHRNGHIIRLEVVYLWLSKYINHSEHEKLDFSLKNKQYHPFQRNQLIRF